MTIYSERDLAVSLSGDFTLSANGDIELANSYESIKSAINFIVRTDRGEYVPDARLGGNLGSFIGESHSKENALAMEAGLLQNLTQFVIARPDISVNIIPISTEEAGLFLGVGGQYIDSDGNLLVIAPEVITYIFPYLDGEPAPLV